MKKNLKEILKVLGVILGIMGGAILVIAGLIYLNMRNPGISQEFQRQAEARKAKAYLVTEVDGCKTYNVYGEFQRGDVVRNASTYFTVCEGSSVVKTGSGNKDEIHETLKGNKQ